MQNFMTESEDNEVSITKDDISVQKTVDQDQFDALAFIFTITSERDEPVPIRLLDRVPDTSSLDNIGFHPEYYADQWTIEEDHIVFAHELPPGGEFTTLYGVRDDTAHPDELTEPTLEIDVHPTSSPDHDSETDPTDREYLSGSLDTTSDKHSPQDTSTPTATSTPSISLDDAPDEESKTPRPALSEDLHTDTIVQAVLTALTEAEDADDTRTKFKNALDIQTGSMDARIEHLQRQVLDLNAYTSSLEEFLDESGTANQIQTDLDELNETLTSVQTRIASNAENLATLESDFADLREDLDDIQTTIDEFETFRDQLIAAITNNGTE